MREPYLEYVAKQRKLDEEDLERESKMSRIWWPFARAICTLFGHAPVNIEHDGDEQWGWRCSRCRATCTPIRGFIEYGR